MPKIRKNIEELSVIVNEMKGIECEKNDIETMSEYYNVTANLKEIRNKLFGNDYIKELLKDKGRIILYNSKKQMRNIYLLVVNHYTDYDGEIWCLSVNGDQNEVMKYKNSKESKEKNRVRK